MIRAGYPPERAMELWQNMIDIGADFDLELLSTHPAGKNRIENIGKAIPILREYDSKLLQDEDISSKFKSIKE